MGASASEVRARVRRVVSYSDESLKGTRRPRLPVLVPCVVYPQLSCSCQPPFGLSEALLARCCCLRRCRAADIIFARHSQFHFSAIAIAEHVRVCTQRWHNSCVPRHCTYPDTVRTQTLYVPRHTRTQSQLVPRRDLRRNRQKSPLNSLDGGSLTLTPIIWTVLIDYKYLRLRLKYKVVIIQPAVNTKTAKGKRYIRMCI